MQYFQLILLVLCGNLINAGFDSNEFDSRSSVTYEFSFLLPGNERSCFYQHITTGAKLKFSYKVLTGATSFTTNAIRSYVRDPSAAMVAVFGMDQEAESPMLHIQEEGDYEFCFNNYHSKYLEKKVEVFIGIINPQNPDLSIEDEKEKGENATINAYQNMTDQVFNIIGSLFHISHFMYFHRRLETVDMALLQEKMTFINRASIFMALIILFVAFAQTYALKRLFRTRLHTLTNKPRA